MVGYGVGEVIRIGLIGHGSAGALIHGPLVEAADGYRIIAVSTSRAESLEARRESPRWEPEPGRLVAADDVDLVVVATPSDTHHRFVREALMAGKAIVVEKPFVMSPGQARDLIDLSRARGRMLMVSRIVGSTATVCVCVR